MPGLNSQLTDLDAYASKLISQLAKRTPNVANLSIGEPAFGPPDYLRDDIETVDLTYASFLDAVKRYETSRGAPELRAEIARWYARRYGIAVDPETEILVTHGGVEAVALAILCTSQPGDGICVTDPSYMLYRRAAVTVGRRAVVLPRPPGSEYLASVDALNGAGHGETAGAAALIVNSPENPTGYIVSREEWASIAGAAERHDLWVIHDEVYDSMSFGADHIPARFVDGLRERAVLVNSFSKKFGIPGLRIGWICGSAPLIDMAEKIHDYLYLGVNILFERIAIRMLRDPRSEAWLHARTEELQRRAETLMGRLTPDIGYAWPRRPMGGMFAFPDVSQLYDRLPPEARSGDGTVGEEVAKYLLREKHVASVPGGVYGQGVEQSLRLVLCTDLDTFERAVANLSG